MDSEVAVASLHEDMQGGRGFDFEGKLVDHFVNYMYEKGEI